MIDPTVEVPQTWQAEETAVWEAVERIQASPFTPDTDNENDPSDTLLYRAARELVATAVERGCALDMVCAFIRMDLNGLEYEKYAAVDRVLTDNNERRQT